MNILNAFNEFVDHERCILGIDNCADGTKKKKCILHDQWVKPKNMIIKMYEETTIENIEGIDFKQ